MNKNWIFIENMYVTYRRWELQLQVYVYFFKLLMKIGGIHIVSDEV